MAITINEILTRHLNGNLVSESVLLAGAFAIELLLPGFLLSTLLALLAVFRMVLAPPNDPDDYVFAAIAISTLIATFLLAWCWNTSDRYAA